MEKGEKFRRTFEKFEKAFKKFEEIINQPSLFDFLTEELIIEITTKRFEYTFEALWKTLKEYLRIEGLISTTPLQCFKESFKRGFVEEKYEKIFFEMVEKRNQIVHIYGFEEAKDIYQFIKQDEIYLAIKSVYQRLKEASI
jgi:nucleotidyltransferase substrate binding protein (TIGR01987 family)